MQILQSYWAEMLSCRLENMSVGEIGENSGSFTFSVFEELQKTGLWRRDSAVEEVLA